MFHLLAGFADCFIDCDSVIAFLKICGYEKVAAAIESYWAIGDEAHFKQLVLDILLISEP